MKRHGRDARPGENGSVRTVLREGDHQYYTSASECDCGTVLGRVKPSAEEMAAWEAKEAARLKRKGWSEAKIARMRSDQGRSGDRYTGPDSFELWYAVLSDLKNHLKLPYVALFVRNYSGCLDSETIAVTKRETRGGNWLEALQSMKEDEVNVFA